MNCHNLDEIIVHFNNKIQIISQLIPFCQLYDKTDVKNQWQRNPVFASNDCNSDQCLDKRPDLREISQMVTEMMTMSEEIKHLLRQRKEQMVYQNTKCDEDLDQIERHLQHIDKNIPTFLQNKNTNSKPMVESIQSNHSKVGHKNQVLKVNPKTNPKPNTKLNANANQTSRVGAKSGQKKVVQKEVPMIPTIAFLTTEEFSSIPHYILGRLTYEVMNRSIGDINRTIASKYRIVLNYSSKYSDEEMRKYIEYKEQENSETEGQYFCTLNDLKTLSDLKIDPTLRKILTCLRHCKRIREIRGNPPKLVRYAVITSDFEFQ